MTFDKRAHRSRGNRRSTVMILAALLLAPGPSTAGDERSVSALHVELGRLDEERETARRRRDRKAEKRLEREMNQVLWQLKQARARQASARSLAPTAHDESSAGQNAGVLPAATPTPAPGIRLPALSELLRKKREREAAPTAPAPPAGTPAAATEGDELIQKQEARIRELDEQLAKLRHDLTVADQAYEACSPAEKEALRPLFEETHQKASAQIASCEETRARAVQSIQEYRQAVEENRRIREEILRDRAAGR